MQKRFATARMAMVAALGLSLVACGQIGALQAKREFRDANVLYTGQDYQGAAEKYEAALRADPTLTEAYFYLGNSYDNLYRPVRAGEPENDALLERAIQNYRLAAERAADPQIRQLALQYLVAAYGPDKLNDPGQAEPVLRQMIELDPEEVANYVHLARVHEDSGSYEEAEALLLEARGIRPRDPNVYMQLANFYNRQGEFDRTMEALEQRAAIEPDNPEAYYTMAAFYQEKAFRDFRLTDEERREYVMDGIEAVNKAIDLNPDYVDALVYKNILLRMQANTEEDRATIDALIEEADEIRDRAMELQERQAAG